MVKFATIKPGDVLYDCRMRRMGNTTMREMGVWRVRVIDVSAEKSTAMVSWNGNAREEWSAHRLAKLRRVPAKGTYERRRYDAEKAEERG